MCGLWSLGRLDRDLVIESMFFFQISSICSNLLPRDGEDHEWLKVVKDIVDVAFVYRSLIHTFCLECLILKGIVFLMLMPFL